MLFWGMTQLIWVNFGRIEQIAALPDVSGVSTRPARSPGPMSQI